MVRVADDEFEGILRERHVRPMDFTGKPLRGFVCVSPLGFRTASALGAWLSRGKRVAHEKAEKQTKRRQRRRTALTAGARRSAAQSRRSQKR